MIALVTDFGAQGPYVGQMEAVLAAGAPGVPVINLVSDAPVARPQASAYLTAALAAQMPAQTLFLAVIDPGVGGERRGLVLRTDRSWFVGPDNGLLAIAARRSEECRLWTIDWRPPGLSASFHGRDLFAPVAARLARGEAPPGEPADPGDMAGRHWPDDLAECIYVDHYGNLFTGLRAKGVDRKALLEAGRHRLRYARTFCEAPPGAAFWYENSCGLVEIAVNRGRADRLLGLGIGDPVHMGPAAGG
ncbi:MAG TPA: hypothetical protein ENI99_10175 [Sedimenticola sp.]|nr:hypothetical protein [Sedimenticola sp.]